MTFLSFTKNDLGDIQPAAEDLRDYLENDDIEGFINIIRALFAKISGKKNVSVFILVLGF